MNFKYYKPHSLIILFFLLIILLEPLSQFLTDLLKKYPSLLHASESIHVFSTLSLVTLFIIIINYWGWKLKIFKWLVDLPNLNGRYIGILESDFQDEEGKNTVMKCAIEIKQTASSIHISSYNVSMKTGIQTSSSFSIVDYLDPLPNDLFEMYCIFNNTPETLNKHHNIHFGTTKFKYFPVGKKLTGQYYNSRGNLGTLDLKFQQKERIGSYFQSEP